MSELRPHESNINRNLVAVSTLVVVLLIGMAIIRMILPLLTVAAIGCAGVWFWQRYQRSHQQQQRSLDDVFYQLIQRHQGQVTVLDLALNARLSATAARQFLDAKAREFTARFEVTEQGDIIYVFPTLTALQTQVVETIPELQPTVPCTKALTQAELARRLGVSAQTLRRKKYEADLLQWSRQKDPDQIGWCYEDSLKKFFPIN